MQINEGSSELQSEINITPLVDVVLVLLIIFMVVVPLLLKGYDIDIPKTSSEAVPSQTEEAQLILTIVPAACPLLDKPAGEGVPDDCRVILAGQEIPAADLPARVAQMLEGRPIEKRVLFLAADDRMNYEGVLRIVDLATSGVEDLQIEFITSD